MLTSVTDEMTATMMDALNGMMLDMMAVIANMDYTNRRRHQQQGIEKLKAEGATSAIRKTSIAMKRS